MRSVDRPGEARPVFLRLACLIAAAVFASCAPKRIAPTAPPGPSEAPGPSAPSFGPAPAGGQPAGRPPGPRGAPSAPGAVPGALPSAPAKPTAYYTHSVRYYGESVSIIAAWYTGSIDNWKALAAANPDINPNRIVVGNRILIPEDIMTRREPMPKEFVDGFYPKGTFKTKHPQPSPPPAREEEEPALFGPKK